MAARAETVTLEVPNMRPEYNCKQKEHLSGEIDPQKKGIKMLMLLERKEADCLSLC